MFACCGQFPIPNRFRCRINLILFSQVEAYKQAKKQSSLLKKWKESGQRKVVVKVESEENLLDVLRNAREAGLIAVYIQDAGLTQVASGTKTVGGIGPGPEKLIDQVTGHLKLY